VNQDENEVQNAIFSLLQRAQLHRSCVSCAYFTEVTEGCEKANGGRPPARVIATSCGEYTEAPPF